jgi:hypothetical protein
MGQPRLGLAHLYCGLKPGDNLSAM